ncbi:hypothetical protein QWA68_017033, partial [Fusarium oxysporum]
MSSLIDPIRAASRQLVRGLGFTGASFANTGLSPSAVHALIEIEGGGVTARALAKTLGLDKSSVSRMLSKLVETGFIEENTSQDDTRIKLLSLTPAGKDKV